MIVSWWLGFGATESASSISASQAIIAKDVNDDSRSTELPDRLGHYVAKGEAIYLTNYSLPFFLSFYCWS